MPQTTRGFLPRDIRPNALDGWIGRMPGPVWTLAVYAGIAAVNLSVVLLLDQVSGTAHTLVTWASVLSVALILSLWLMGSRTPRWVIHTDVVLIICMATLLVAVAATPVGAVTAGFGYLTISLYVSYWMPRAQSLAYVFVMSLLYLGAIAYGDFTDLVAPWMLTVATMLIVLFVLSALRQALESAASTDELTGLFNRRALEALIVANATDRRERARTIVTIDLDEFKLLNDRKGHLAGDRALRDFGRACQRTLRPGDMAFRTGGDEFVLVLERLSPDNVPTVMSRLHDATTVRWSHGCAEWPPRADFDSALASADAALYRDKQDRKAARHPESTPETE